MVFSGLDRTCKLFLQARAHGSELTAMRELLLQETRHPFGSERITSKEHDAVSSQQRKNARTIHIGTSEGWGSQSGTTTEILLCLCFDMF